MISMPLQVVLPPKLRGTRPLHSQWSISTTHPRDRFLVLTQKDIFLSCCSGFHCFHHCQALAVSLANHQRNASRHGHLICHPHPHDHGFQTSSCCHSWPQRNYREIKTAQCVFGLQLEACQMKKTKKKNHSNAPN